MTDLIVEKMKDLRLPSHSGNPAGFSMIEVVVAIAVVAICLGPLVNMLSQSNRVSSASIYELMAVHYAEEITEQLVELTPKLHSLVLQARIQIGNSSLNLGTILGDGSFNSELEFRGDAIKAVPLEVSGNQLQTSLLLSPLHERFTRRSVDVTQLDYSTNTQLKTGNYWKVGITLAWTLNPSEASDAHSAYFAVILHEKP